MMTDLGDKTSAGRKYPESAPVALDRRLGASLIGLLTLVIIAGLISPLFDIGARHATALAAAIATKTR